MKTILLLPAGIALGAMSWALCGAVTAQLLFARPHDRSIARAEAAPR